MLNFLTSLFTEKKCYGCHQSGHFFCLKCMENISIYSPYCYVCKKDSPYFSVHNHCLKHLNLKQVIVLTRYRYNGIKKLLRHAKYYGKYKAYEDIIFQNKSFFRENVKVKDSIFIPVPMYFFRKWKRGYNQADIIAEYLGEVCSVRVEYNFIKRIKSTTQQSKLKLRDRSKNLSGGFKIMEKFYQTPKNWTIYLIDDIISSGHTVQEVSNMLIDAGYVDIRVIALASD